MANKLDFFGIIKGNDIIIAVIFIISIMMLIIPVPSILLDILIIINISVSLCVLFMSLYVKKASDFAVFPSILLITTIFRLGINVSSTRLILSQGAFFNGSMVKTFGNFVVQNNYIIGAIIFIILIAVQFIVIIKGSTRVSEVAARFTLDSLPGKQMSIDSDLSTGIIDDKIAKLRRENLRKEVDFYGAMDGASKFVQGDVKVGLLITFINLIGGLLVGVLGLSLSGISMTLYEAFNTFFILTVGDGLSAQIPSLLLSTATGIIVTRASSDSDLSEDTIDQISLHPKIMLMTSGFLYILILIPGFPKITLFIIASIFLYFYVLLSQYVKDKSINEGNLKKDEAAANQSKSDSIQNFMNIDLLELEIGFGLVPLVSEESGGDLLERIKLVRKNCVLELGLVVPPIRIRDNVKLDSNLYIINIRGLEVGRFNIYTDKLLAIPNSHESKPINGLEVHEPSFNSIAYWIDQSDKDSIEASGYSIIDPGSIIATHLTEVIKQYAFELLGRQEVKNLIDKLKEVSPVIVEELLKVTTIGKVQKVLQMLLEENISLRDLGSIFEAITDNIENVANLESLLEMVRVKLSRQISNQYSDENKVLYVSSLSPKLEYELEKYVENTSAGIMFNIPPDNLNKLASIVKSSFLKTSQMGYNFIILCSPKIRYVLSRVLSSFIKSIIVLSYNEISSQVTLEKIDIIDM